MPQVYQPQNLDQPIAPGPYTPPPSSIDAKRFFENLPDRHVLIIEDDSLMADLVEHLLRRMGFLSIDVANSAMTAMTSVCRREPDVVLADILLDDGSNGIEIAHRIHQRSMVPVVFLSARASLAKHEGRATILEKKDLNATTLTTAIAEACDVWRHG